MKKRMHVYWVCGAGSYRGWAQSVEAAHARMERNKVELSAYGSTVSSQLSQGRPSAPATLCLCEPCEN